MPNNTANEEDYSGKVAMLNTSRIKKHKRDLSKEYLDFVEKNRHTKFILKAYNRNANLYTISDDCPYTFHISDIVVLEGK